MRAYASQKSALTRAINSGEPARVIAACTEAVREWEMTSWPDDWARWQRALDDITPIGQWHRINLEDLI